MKKSIGQVVEQAINGASRIWLEEVVAHGIHNITNDYNGENYEEYEAYSDEFRRQAEDALEKMRRHEDEWGL